MRWENVMSVPIRRADGTTNFPGLYPRWCSVDNPGIRCARRYHSIFKIGVFSNSAMNRAFVVSLAMQLAVLLSHSSTRLPYRILAVGGWWSWRFITDTLLIVEITKAVRLARAKT